MFNLEALLFIIFSMVIISGFVFALTFTENLGIISCFFVSLMGFAGIYGLLGFKMLAFSQIFCYVLAFIFSYFLRKKIKFEETNISFLHKLVAFFVLACFFGLILTILYKAPFSLSFPKFIPALNFSILATNFFYFQLIGLLFFFIFLSFILFWRKKI